MAQRFVHGPAQPEHHDRGQATDAEGDAPAPGRDFRLGPEDQHGQQGQLRQHVAADQGDVVERGQQTATARKGGFGHVRGAGPVLAAGGEALQQAGEQQDQRRPATNAGGGGGQCDQERTGGHHRHRHGQRQAAAVTVGKAAEVPRADRAHQEGGGEDRPHIDGGVLVVGREELRFEVDREHRVHINVVPLDQVAGRAFQGVGDRAFERRLVIKGRRKGGGVAHAENRSSR